MPFGWTAQDLQNLIMAITALVVALDTMWSKLAHKNVKQVQSDVQDLKNGELKAKVKEAINELPNVEVTKGQDKPWQR